MTVFLVAMSCGRLLRENSSSDAEYAEKAFVAYFLTVQLSMEPLHSHATKNHWCAEFHASDLTDVVMMLVMNLVGYTKCVEYSFDLLERVVACLLRNVKCQWVSALDPVDKIELLDHDRRRQCTLDIVVVAMA